jgi:oxaloacetate decarboxylase alpha subunit
MDGARRTAALAKRSGFDDVVAGICYTTSPVHTDEYFAAKIAELDSCPDIDSIYLKDPAGLLTPERLRTLQPKLQGALHRLKLNEIHSHSTTGVSPQTVLTAADLGMEIIHCALPPLANGSSHPSAPRLAANLVARGHSVSVNVQAMERASAYLTRQARIKKLPIGVPSEYDEAYYRHTIPGGVQSTLKRQLAEMGRADVFEAVIEESVQVREDLGWPIVMTPFAQYIVTQAALNVIGGERYRQVSDEIINLLNGEFGPLPGPVNPELLDRAAASQESQRERATQDEILTRADLRSRFGKELSDEELLLRAVMPSEQVDAMVASRSGSNVNAIKAILEASDGAPRSGTYSVTRGEYSLSLTKATPPGEDSS